MTKSTKPGKRQGINLKGEGSTDEGHARDLAKQRAWAYAVADGIERGELPIADDERLMLAAILRSAADQLPERPRKRRGNPGKLPDDDSAPLMVRMRERSGESDALQKVAEYFGVDESSLAKICRTRRAAIDEFFRDAVTVGKGRRNSGNSA